MRVLVTGAEGYIGAILLPYLAARGIEVTGLDTGFYRDGWLYSDNEERPRSPTIIYKDLRRCTQEDVAGCRRGRASRRAVERSARRARPEITRQINHGGSVRLARLAQARGRPALRLHVFVQRLRRRHRRDPRRDLADATRRPPTRDARCWSSATLGAMADDDFSPMFLRNATAYGASPRMRFDIVLNDLAALAWTTGKIAMTSDGTPWRPLVHVAGHLRGDRAARCEAPADAVHGEIFNVGADNARTTACARSREIVAERVPGLRAELRRHRAATTAAIACPSTRSTSVLPGFECSWSARDGARAARTTLFERIADADARLTSSAPSRG